MNAQIIVTSCNRRDLELGQMGDFLQGNGIDVSADNWNIDKDADLIFLSTCGFTQAAEDFGFSTLHRLNREKKASAEVVMCGCIPEINIARTKAEFGGRAFSPQNYGRLDQIIDAKRPFSSFARPNVLTRKTLRSRVRDDLAKSAQVLRSFDGSFAGIQKVARALGARVTRRLIRGSYANLSGWKTYYIQIQEGCSMECSYCVIRTAIGRLRSRPVDAVLKEFKSGLELGYKEFQLMGDNAGSYGLDIGSSLGNLLTEINRLEGDFKLDLTDISPAYLHSITGQIIEMLRAGRIARLYVPVQSGSPRILRLMKRPCDVEQLRADLKSIRAAATAKGGFKLGTSLIVGFPSETNEELAMTIEFCRDIGFDWIWCHSFSARPETPAAAMSDLVDSLEILRRAQLLKSELKAQSMITNALDSSGSITCQG